MHPGDARPRPEDGPDRLPPSAETVWAVGPSIKQADIPVLCAAFAARLRESGTALVVFDAGRIITPAAVTVEALARLQLEARHLGCDVKICGARQRLIELVRFVGLSGVLELQVLAVEQRRQSEQREKTIGVEERVEPADATG